MKLLCLLHHHTSLTLFHLHRLLLLSLLSDSWLLTPAYSLFSFVSGLGSRTQTIPHLPVSIPYMILSGPLTGSTNHMLMLIQLYLLLKLSPRVQTHSSSIVLSWRSNRHVILNMTKTELLISSPKLDPPTEISILLAQFSSLALLCLTLCKPMNHSTPGIPVHHQLPEFTQTHVHRVVMPPSHLILCLTFSFCPQSLPASRSFPMSQLFASGGQSIGVSASTLVLPMNTQDWSPLGWTAWISLQSKGLSRVFSSTIVQKHQFFSAQLSSQCNSHIHT